MMHTGMNRIAVKQPAQKTIKEEQENEWTQYDTYEAFRNPYLISKERDTLAYASCILK